MNLPVRKALTPVGVESVNREDIPTLIRIVASFTGIPVSDLHTLGSTGKEPISGDVDLAVDSTKYMEPLIHDLIASAIGEENCFYSALSKVHSYAVPLNNIKVQVDLMFTKYLEWAKFAYYSDGLSNGRTAYKGAIRTILLRAVASVISEPGIDFQGFSGDELVLNVGRTFDLQRGLRRLYQYKPVRKHQGNGKGQFVKKMARADSFEALQAELGSRTPYPIVLPSLSPASLVFTEPLQALEFMFPGAPVTPEQVCTAEQVLRLIETRFEPRLQKRICDKAMEKMALVADKMRVMNI